MNHDASPSTDQQPAAITFRTTILQTGKNTTGIEVPETVIAGLGASKRPLVRVTLNGYSYRSAVAVMGGKFMIGLSAEHRQAAGVAGGDQLDVTLELDLAPRAVEIPSDLASALDQAGVRAAFEQAAPSRRKEYLRQVAEAKAEDTRLRRIAKIVEALQAG